MKTLLQVNKISKSYGDRSILEDATVSLGEKQKIGVIGRNGAGKSTLGKIIFGDEEADGGEIIMNQDLRLSRLEQKDPYEKGERVLEFLQRYTDKEDWECGKLAGRFQLKGDVLEKEIHDLPGGFQMRVKLTAMLLTEPNFILLDEPTNYLDLNTLMLLEKFLREYNGGFMIISHDREFLKNTCDETMEVESGEISIFPGAVEEYLEFKAEQREQQIRYNKNIEGKQKQLQTFVDRFGAKASKAAQARSKQKQLESLHTIEIKNLLKNVTITIPQVEVRKGASLRLKELGIGYPDKTVAEGIEIAIERGAHVAVLGDNGQGKSTLLKTIAGELEPKSGSFEWAPGMEVSYFAQNVYEALNPKHDVYTHLELSAAKGVGRQEIMNMAGSFLFSGDDILKKVAVLSGGERARACLAGMLLSKSNVFLLDEPTNHLDFETVEALGEALREYKGTVFFISHDRTFVSQVATNIIEVKEGDISLYPGTYEEYVFSMEVRIEKELEASGGAPSSGGNAKSKSGAPAAAPADGKSRRQLRKQWTSTLNKKKKELVQVEAEMEKQVKEKEEILKWMADNPGEYSPEKNKRMEALESGHATAEESYLTLLDEVEKLEKDLAET